MAIARPTRFYRIDEIFDYARPFHDGRTFACLSVIISDVVVAFPGKDATINQSRNDCLVLNVTGRRCHTQAGKYDPLDP
uniref:Transposase n=1 Tax=Echinococcus granulosus TaxID=6210 RepID=A0A068WQA3_ECHGR|nr:hypothetical protein EgrG_002024300 [Echinococcus granulosus]